jgi:hypothetical protein
MGFLGPSGGGDNSASLAAQEAAQQQAQQQQQWLQEQTTAQQATQNQATQAQLTQANATAANQQAADKAKQAQLVAAQEKAAEAAAAPYTTAQTGNALQPLNTNASILAGAAGANQPGLPGFNAVLAANKNNGFLGQQNSLSTTGSTGVKLGGS